MNIYKTGKIKYLTFSSLDRLGIVRDVFTTREGGVSTGCHASMNLGFTNGDTPENVYRNFELMAPVIGVSQDHIVRTHQTHTTNIYKVTRENVYDDGQLHDSIPADIDGLVTDERGICLATFYADCVPLYFVDPVIHAIGLSHSGWRGTVNRMGACTVRRMSEEYGCRPSDIYAAIGPSICQDCYEIGTDVAEQFVKAFGSERYLKSGKEEGKYQLDLQAANRDILIEAGVSEDHIELPGICTCCNPELLFSHRASHGKRGNLAAFLMLV